MQRLYNHEDEKIAEDLPHNDSFSAIFGTEDSKSDGLQPRKLSYVKRRPAGASLQFLKFEEV